jgi:hypothetical protein
VAVATFPEQDVRLDRPAEVVTFLAHERLMPLQQTAERQTWKKCHRRDIAGKTPAIKGHPAQPWRSRRITQEIGCLEHYCLPLSDIRSPAAESESSLDQLDKGFTLMSLSVMSLE